MSVSLSSLSTSATPPADPPATPTPPATPPAFSEEESTKLKEEISKGVSESVIQKIGKALGLTKEEEEGLPKSKEALTKLVSEGVQAEFKRRDAEVDKEDKETDKQRQDRVDGIVRGWHSQYEAVGRAGKVPKVENAQDPNDKGVVARRKIILGIGKIREENKKQGIDHIPTISEVLLTYPNILSGPPGADLPISGNTRVKEEGDSFTYPELHEPTFEEIAAGD